MASWSAVLALTGFHYSGVSKEIKFGDITGKYFWSNGYSYGTIDISRSGSSRILTLKVLNGKIDISKITINGFGSFALKSSNPIKSGENKTFTISQQKQIM